MCVSLVLWRVQGSQRGTELWSEPPSDRESGSLSLRHPPSLYRTLYPTFSRKPIQISAEEEEEKTDNNEIVKVKDPGLVASGASSSSSVVLWLFLRQLASWQSYITAPFRLNLCTFMYVWFIYVYGLYISVNVCRYIHKDPCTEQKQAIKFIHFLN